MSKRKLRFNAIDVLILLVIAAVLFVLLYVFVLSDNKSEQAEVEYQNIQYVIELTNLDERFDGTVQRGQKVQDAIEKKNIGVVSGVQTVPYEKITFNYDEGKETVATMEGRVSMKITVDARAVENDRDFTVDGCVIKVGRQYSLILPEMYASGYCIEIVEK